MVSCPGHALFFQRFLAEHGMMAGGSAKLHTVLMAEFQGLKKRLADWDHGQTIPSDLVYVSFDHCHTHGDLARAPIAKRLCHDSFRRETQNLRQEGEQYANIKPNIRDFSSTYDISR